MIMLSMVYDWNHILYFEVKQIIIWDENMV